MSSKNKFNIFSSEYFSSAIEKSLAESCNGYSREPCYTAALTKGLPEILNKIIEGNALGNSSDYRFGSCYVHQKPYVRFGENFALRCELGDLLVLVKKRINGSDVFNSALFQLKKTDCDKFKVSQNGGEDTQFLLYTKWGPLRIDLKSERSITYDITPHSVSQGGSYMFVRQHRQCPKFVVTVPDREMVTLIKPSYGYGMNPLSLGRYLYNMVEWRCGRAISSQNEVTSDDWSKLIWRVVELLKAAKCNCKEFGQVTRNNGCDNLSFMMECPELTTIDATEDSELSSKDDSGFGILYIEQISDRDRCNE